MKQPNSSWCFPPLQLGHAGITTTTHGLTSVLLWKAAGNDPCWKTQSFKY